MNIVNYIRFGKDPRNGAQHQPQSPKDGFSSREVEEVGEMAQAPVEVKPIPIPNYTTRDWLARFAKEQD